ncbi:beta-2 adrenergic receptor-like [Lytechinus variegatus]|uniref:beta-2 adrenergic receptor-like n=1 Tax=Lytechinus variegatus TaxID=7654 RepID=UPI001BB228E3|nr:beta-2 adrenergic receptor-like [Lytechinus variegatus]
MRLLYQVLATSDLILGITWSLWDYFWFSRDYSYCFVISLVFPYPFEVSLWFMMICLSGISLNLYLLVTRPLRYHTIASRKRFVIVLVTSLIVTTLVCGIYIPIPGSPIVQLLKHRCQARNLTAEGHWTSILHTFFLVGPICATLTFTTTIYIRLLVIARKKVNVVGTIEIQPVADRLDAYDDSHQNRYHPSTHPQIMVERHQHDHDRRRKKRCRTFKGFWTILLLTGSFSMVWIPYTINLVAPTDVYTSAALDMMSICSTWVQPIVYLMTNSEARRHFLKYISILFRRICRCVGMVTIPRVLGPASHISHPN